MSVIIVLISISLFIAIGFLLAYVWAHKAGQYDDIETQGVRMLFEKKSNSNNKKI